MVAETAPTQTADAPTRPSPTMTDDSQARWVHFEDAPGGATESDRFTEFRKPLTDLGAESLDVSLIEVGPGESGPKHAHWGSVEEFYVVLEGEMAVELADEVVRARQGTTFFFPPGAPHQPFNDSGAPPRFLTMRTGEGERTVRD